MLVQLLRPHLVQAVDLPYTAMLGALEMRPPSLTVPIHLVAHALMLVSFAKGDAVSVILAVAYSLYSCPRH